MARCRSCGKEIDWVRTIDGKNKPVDPEYLKYDDCEPGIVLVTDGGNTIRVEVDFTDNIFARVLSNKRGVKKVKTDDGPQTSR